MTPYAGIEFEPAPPDRPVVYINMIATIDGKTVSGTRDEGVMDLGSDVDHEAMRRLDAASDAVLVGARTLRASPRTWRPRGRISLVATRSGDLPRDARYFEGESYVIAPEDGEYPAPWLNPGPLSPPGERGRGEGSFRPVPAKGSKVSPHPCPSPPEGRGVLDWHAVLKTLREKGVERLYVLGGSELNAQLLERDLVDELFLTVAPKIRLGTDLPTYAGGEPLPRGGLMDFRLIESHVVGDEVFLRYRRRKE